MICVLTISALCYFRRNPASTVRSRIPFNVAKVQFLHRHQQPVPGSPLKRKRESLGNCVAEKICFACCGLKCQISVKTAAGPGLTKFPSELASTKAT